MQRLDDLGLEYRFVAKYLQNKLSKEEMLEQLETAINQYAKRQMTWFKKDKRITWLNSKDVPVF
jgi:tRNA dimethylallyltransferase